MDNFTGSVTTTPNKQFLARHR